MSGHPVQVARFDKNSDGLEINIDALAEICLNDKCRKRPLSVVSIAGDFRKGKSFMLNFFLRYLHHISDEQNKGDWIGEPESELEGFSWRGGSKADTIGILLWSEPIVVKRHDGQEVAVLLMDTQGAFDSRQTIGQTAIIFALSTLTSSLQIYNIMNNIQEDNLQMLDIFSAYGQLILDKSTEKPFQHLCFLVRDWRSPTDHNYGAEGGSSLLKEKLQIDPEDPDSADNRTRERIESCFEKKSCFLLPYPGEKVSVDENGAFKGQLSFIKDNFLEHLKEFVPMVLGPENLSVKKIGGATVNGQSMLTYFQAYSEIFKGGTMPEPKNLYDAMAEVSNSQAYERSKAFYIESMRSSFGVDAPRVDPKILDQAHYKVLKDALNMFATTKKLGDDDYSRSYYDDLHKDLVEIYESFAELNSVKPKGWYFSDAASLKTGYQIITVEVARVCLNSVPYIHAICNAAHVAVMYITANEKVRKAQEKMYSAFRRARRTYDELNSSRNAPPSKDPPRTAPGAYRCTEDPIFSTT